MENSLKVTNVRYFETNKGLGYECKTSVKDLYICNDGNGGGTYISSATKLAKPYQTLSEWDLEGLINKYENVKN